MSKAMKELMMREYQTRMKGADEALLIGIRGLKGTQTTKVRATLHKKNIRIAVVRNNLARKTFADTKLSALEGMLSGATAVAFGGQSIVEVAREIVKLMEQFPTIELKGAILDGTVYTGKAGVTELSKFPTKDEAIANILTLVVSPARKLAAQAKGPGSNLAGIIKAIETKLEKGEAIAPVA